MARSEKYDLLLRDAERALRAADPAAFLVSQRVLKRVIHQDREMPGLGFYVPHRKSYWLPHDRILWIVARDELGIDNDAPLPETAILLARPAEHKLPRMTAADLQRQLWRLLYHVRVHLAFERKLASGQLKPADIRERIDRIGQAEFDEIQAVLRQENLLLPPANPQTAYVEFAAVYLELQHFAPHWLATYFPSLDDFPRVDEILAEDVDAADLFERTRLAGAERAVVADVTAEERTLELSGEVRPGPAAPNPRVMQRLVVKAERDSMRGNTVRATLRYVQAQAVASPERATELQILVDRELEMLSRRLQAALEFEDDQIPRWRAALEALVANSARGFWNADKRLLSDLQNVCIAHEREVSTVDLLEWVFSFGRRPIRRPLPNQREVLMSKNLRRAASRLASVKLSGRERAELSHLLHDAATSAEEQMRFRLRPLIRQALDDVGLRPVNVPERVAGRKVMEELLDGVAANGFFTIGDLRDAISRNNLKLSDLAGPSEVLFGDELLRADRRLAETLDGVYQRGDFYLRWLQSLSSAAFGTPVGRFITQYLVLPLGGALVILEGVDHLLHLFAEHPVRLSTWPTIFGVGLFLFGLMHVNSFRTFVLHLVRTAWQLIWRIVIDLPKFIVRWTFLEDLFRSPPVLFLRRLLLTPLLVTLLLSRVMPALNLYQQPTWLGELGLLTALVLVFNSRIGRTVQEATSEAIEQLWHQIRVRVFVALFEVIVENFRWLLEAIERLMYAVDEWLRFKSGETSVTLAVKAVLSVVWHAVSFVLRFCVTLLIEPQINPIKHFPVVTVAHKLLLPLAVTTRPSAPSWLAELLLLVAPVSVQTANAICLTVVWGIPGIFGFLVWELKENWKLFAANRKPQLRPALVGDHGETMIRLMKPGFHSGTLPKLFGKLRRAERNRDPIRREEARNKYHARLHHMEDALRRFVQRELVALLMESHGWGEAAIDVRRIEIASNGLRIELACPELSPHSLWLSFQEQSGWLLASVENHGWLLSLSVAQRAALRMAIAGLYKLSGVDLVREQIESCFEPRTLSYDVTERGLLVWPDGGYEVEARYDLQSWPTIRPVPRRLARDFQLPDLPSRRLIFALWVITWHEWVQAWEAEGTGQRLPALFPEEIRLLPATDIVPLAEQR